MIDEELIRKLVTRLSRDHGSGGRVIERAAILAEGAVSQSILEWVVAHDGQPEALPPALAGGGLHAKRADAGSGAGARTPRRYVLPPGVLP